MKAVLLSIKPNWAKLILSGVKTVEVRRTRPKLETPFKVYIYVTKATQRLITIFKDGEETMDGEIHHGKSAFIKCDAYLPDIIRDKTQTVVGEFTCDKIERVKLPDPVYQYESYKPLTKDSCLSCTELYRYASHKDLFFWHISDLKIYDKPLELDEFYRFDFYGLNGTGVCGNEDCENYEPSDSYMIPPTCKINGCFISRPPQSWCYVEEIHA